jgi:hypothetical protein
MGPAGPTQDAARRNVPARVRLRVRRSWFVPRRFRACGSQNGTGRVHRFLFDNGDEVTVQAGDAGIRFLLVSGKPIEEPVAWHGPIVMNTDDELRQAYTELRDGTFIKHR